MHCFAQHNQKKHCGTLQVLEFLCLKGTWNSFSHHPPHYSATHSSNRNDWTLLQSQLQEPLQLISKWLTHAIKTGSFQLWLQLLLWIEELWFNYSCTPLCTGNTSVHAVEAPCLNPGRNFLLHNTVLTNNGIVGVVECNWENWAVQSGTGIFSLFFLYLSDWFKLVKWDKKQHVRPISQVSFHNHFPQRHQYALLSTQIWDNSIQLFVNIIWNK